ncbi:uncharacterized protein DNG_05665 [Cephalotrichum gorgonifer]|uniref:Uncharacterized protein n=1 Tax=Cephalotrichum gorgonifer TaxID=2041049 RepID=A0AAE8SVY9_9PEZI|nr:uncharacterized protein DNG_05665 [Cephalotrichum gorgonifer]
MAEILGIVASGLTVVEVAARLGTGAFTLKRVWAQVKGAPQTITALVDEIGMISPLLEQLEADTTSLALPDHTTHSDPSAKQAVDFCRRALDEVSAITDDLTAQVNSAGKARRGAAKVKIALRKDLLADYENRLRWVVTILGLAQQYYLVTLVKRQPVLLANMLEERNIPPETQEQNTRPRPSKPSSAILCNSVWQEELRKPWFPRKRITPSIFGNFAIQSSCQPQGSGAKSAHCIQLRPPTWLTRKVWDVLVSKSYSGFDFTLRGYSIVPRDSAAFKFAYAGDLDGLRGLFDSKRASPFDRLPSGDSLLYFALTQSLDAMQLVLPSLRPGTSELPIDERIQAFSMIMSAAPTEDANALCLLLYGSRGLLEGEVRHLHEREWGLFQSLAFFYSRIACYSFKERGSAAHRLWRAFTCDAVELTMELYKHQNHLHDILFGPASHLFSATTPMFQVVCGVTALRHSLYPYNITFSAWRRDTEKSLRLWLADLKLSGVDLMEYGVQEAYAFSHDPWVALQRYGPGVEEPSEWVCELEGFYFGSELQDWHFTWDMGVEEFVGDFWHSIEDPWLHIPGAWTDD